jgi:hypothetical protein
MRAVSLALYHALRGGGAVIEGAEFLLTHRHIPRRLVLHFSAAATCTLIAIWLGTRLAAALPAPPVIALPWYLVLVEWLWSSLPIVLATQFVAWSALAAYVAVALPQGIVSAVLTQRGVMPPSTLVRDPRSPVLAWLSAGGVGCALIAWVPVVGPGTAAVLGLPVLGGGLVVTTLTLLGWSKSAIRSAMRTHLAVMVGLGLGLALSLAIPVVNLVALPCAFAGTACLLLREPRPAEQVRTNEETVPCALPEK